MPNLKSTLEMHEDEFKKQYGIYKPKKTDAVVTHCFVGGRAGKAAETLRNMGFINALSYNGSFKDWIAKGGKVEEVKE